MEFYRIFNEILSEKNLTIPDVARMTGLRDSTLRSIISRKQSNVVLEIAFKISNALDVSLERLNGDEASVAKNTMASMQSQTPASDLTKDEKQLLSGYRELTNQGKEYMLQTLVMAQNTYKKACAVPYMEDSQIS